MLITVKTLAQTNFKVEIDPSESVSIAFALASSFQIVT